MRSRQVNINGVPGSGLTTRSATRRPAPTRGFSFPVVTENVGAPASGSPRRQPELVRMSLLARP